MWPLDGVVQELATISAERVVAVLCLHVAALLAASLVGAVLRATVWAVPRRPVAGAHVVITGGSEGIGLAIGVEAARQHARVTIMARSVGKLEAAVVQIKAAAPGGTSTSINYVQCDVTDSASATKAFDEAAELAPIDFVVCAAGAAYPGYFLEQDLAIFERTMRLNYLGSVFTAKAAVPAMVARSSGHLILISSGAAAASFLGYSSYAPTKFAVRGLADALRNELCGTGVRVSVAYPPDTDTPGFEQENKTKPPECMCARRSSTPLNFLCTLTLACGSRISPPEVHAASDVAKLILDASSRGVYHLPSPDYIQVLWPPLLLTSASAYNAPTPESADSVDRWYHTHLRCVCTAAAAISDHLDRLSS